MTPGDPCRCCGGPPPAPWKPTLPQLALRLQFTATWRHTIGSTDAEPRRDWICLSCQAWAARAARLVA